MSIHRIFDSISRTIVVTVEYAFTVGRRILRYDLNNRCLFFFSVLGLCAQTLSS